MVSGSGVGRQVSRSWPSQARGLCSTGGRVGPGVGPRLGELSDPFEVVMGTDLGAMIRSEPLLLPDEGMPGVGTAGADAGASAAVSDGRGAEAISSVCAAVAFGTWSGSLQRTVPS